MSDKLLAYLDRHPLVVSIWVNPDLLYTTGPVDGFEKVSRDEALQLCLDVSPEQEVKDPAPDAPVNTGEENANPEQEVKDPAPDATDKKTNKK